MPQHPTASCTASGLSFPVYEFQETGEPASALVMASAQAPTPLLSSTTRSSPSLGHLGCPAFLYSTPSYPLSLSLSALPDTRKSEAGGKSPLFAVSRQRIIRSPLDGVPHVLAFSGALTGGFDTSRRDLGNPGSDGA